VQNFKHIDINPQFF